MVHIIIVSMKALREKLVQRVLVLLFCCGISDWAEQVLIRSKRSHGQGQSACCHNSSPTNTDAAVD